MIKVTYALEKTILDEYVQTKQDIHNAKKSMSANEVLQAKKEIILNAKINDVPREFDPKKQVLFDSSDEGIARVNIEGLLTNEVSACAAFFDESVTTYSYIAQATMQADEDPSIHTIEYYVNSGGGYTDGLDMTAQIMASCKKKKRAMVSSMAGSAAYYLASQCDEILALTPSSYFGSIGVAVEIIDVSKAEEDAGIKRYQLASTDAPNKRPDYSTEAGRGKILKMLDEMHEIFVQRVSEGRTRATGKQVSENYINKNFGQGGVLIAKDALAAGMIDGFAFKNAVDSTKISTNKSEEPAPAGDEKSEVVNMNLHQFLSENPEAKAEYEKELKAGETELQARIEAAKPFLAPESVYGKAIKNLAFDVISGEATERELRTAVAIADEISEKSKSESAKDESKEQGDIKAEQHSISDGNKIETIEDEQALIAKLQEL